MEREIIHELRQLKNSRNGSRFSLNRVNYLLYLLSEVSEYVLVPDGQYEHKFLMLMI